jgi:hypothetical protein
MHNLNDILVWAGLLLGSIFGGISLGLYFVALNQRDKYLIHGGTIYLVPSIIIFALVWLFHAA